MSILLLALSGIRSSFSVVGDQQSTSVINSDMTRLIADFEERAVDISDCPNLGSVCLPNLGSIECLFGFSATLRIRDNMNLELIDLSSLRQTPASSSADIDFGNLPALQTVYISSSLGDLYRNLIGCNDAQIECIER